MYQRTDKENCPNKQSPGRTHTWSYYKTPMLLTPDLPEVPCKAALRARHVEQTCQGGGPGRGLWLCRARLAPRSQAQHQGKPFWQKAMVTRG